jgi:hypothetical protein
MNRNMARFLLYCAQAESLVPMEDNMQTIGTEMAFPVPGSENNYMAEGMTKREYFAALALQGLLAGDVYEVGDVDGFAGYAAHYSKSAVSHADALIAALNE